MDERRGLGHRRSERRGLATASAIYPHERHDPDHSDPECRGFNKKLISYTHSAPWLSSQ